MTVKDISSSYGSEIIFRRWAAVWIDIAVYMLLYGLIRMMVRIPEGWFTVVVVVVVPCIYHTLFEAILGFTIGKWLIGIRVTNSEGEIPGFVRAILRTIVRILEVNPLLFGGVPAGLIADRAKYHQRLGDMIAGTYVLRLQDIHQYFPSSSSARIGGPYCHFFNRKEAT